MRINIIVAMTHSHIIGDQGNLPWKINEDLINFRNLTIGHTVIMGRKTYDSIISSLGKPLPNRHNIVISNTIDSLPDGVIVCANLELAIEAAHAIENNEIFIIGGAQIYEQALPLTDRLIISWIKKNYTGDTKFPMSQMEGTHWKMTDYKSFAEFDVNTYQRI